jgi:hypothetical protein
MTFLVPIVLIVIWGAVFSKADSGPQQLRLAFLNNSSSPIGKEIESTLDTMRAFALIRTYKDEQGKKIPFDTNSIKEFVRKGNAPAALVLPADLFTDSSAAIKLKFYYDPKNLLEIQVIDGMIRQIAYRQLPNIFNQVTTHGAQAYLGKVQGWAMMFLLFTLTASASSLFEEKRSGVVLRLLASPVSRVHILWSKYLYNMSLGFIQLCILFAFGALLYKIDIISNFFNLLIIVVAAATACAAFGMLLASISRTAAQANGLGTLLILTMSSVGGAWFPTSFMPSYVQVFSKLTLVYWAMDGFLKVLWSGSGIIDILPNIAILFSIAIVITFFSVWQFKKGHVF